MFAKDTVALVTGAATGIGYAAAAAYSRAGCRVVVSDRDTQRGEAAARLHAFFSCCGLWVRGPFGE